MSPDWSHEPIAALGYRFYDAGLTCRIAKGAAESADRFGQAFVGAIAFGPGRVKQVGAGDDGAGLFCEAHQERHQAGLDACGLSVTLHTMLMRKDKGIANVKAVGLSHGRGWRKREGSLQVNAGSEVLDLTPVVLDHFRGGAPWWFGYDTHFLRSDQGNVTGFRLSNYHAKGIHFERLQ